jgi:glycolate oxidase iron-sulfur subunit
MARLVLLGFAYQAVMRCLMLGARMLRASNIAALGSRLPGRVGLALAMVDATRSTVIRRKYVASGSGARGTVALLDGCVMDGLYRETNRATARTLTVNDYRIVRAPGQGCCGALHAHAGDLEVARRLARTNIAAFEASHAEHTAVNAAGCGAMLKEYGHLLAHDRGWAARASDFSARVRDVSELLADAGPVKGALLPLSVTYDAPCHLLHAQRVARAPLQVLEAIPGLVIKPLMDSDQCCGAAGIYNLVEPGISQAVLAPKLRNIGASEAAYVVTGNPGCLMQIGAGLRHARMTARVAHPVDLLDASYAMRTFIES